MADTTDKKTYLVNIQDNLDKYAKDAAAAKKQVDELTKANEALKASSTASAVEIEKSNAALRNAQKEYSNAKKLQDQAVLANKAQQGSYEQLYRTWQLAQTQLKLMGGSYVQNEKGVWQLSKRYVEQKKVVDDLKQSIDAFGKGIHDNRLNVGNYSEAIEGALGKLQQMPGATGQAAMGVSGLTASFKAMLANPVYAAIAAIVAVFAGLIKVFKGTAEGGGKIKDLFAGIGAVLTELRNRVVSFINIFQHVFRGEWKEAGEAARDTFTKLGSSIKDAYESAHEMSEAQRQLTKELAFHISEEAKEDNLIQKYIYLSKDRNKADAERLDYLEKALAIGKEKAAKEVEYAKRQFEIDVTNAARKGELDKKALEDWIKLDADQQNIALKNSALLQNAYNLIGKEGVQKLEEAYAAMIKADTAFYEHMKRAESQRSSLVAEIAKDNEERLKAIQKQKDDLGKAIDDYRRDLLKYRKADRDRLQDQQEALTEHLEWERDRRLTNEENILAAQEARVGKSIALERQRLVIAQKDEIAAAKKTGADVNAINQKYAALQQQLDRAWLDEKLSLYGDFAGSLAEIFGRDTAIGKAAAIAQATISTYNAAAKALAAYPPPFSYIAMAAAIAAGIANVQKIIAVKSGLPGENAGATAPTAITASAPAQHYTGMAVNPTFYTMPQLTQSQVNALPNQNIITPEALLSALKAMPAPVVTVEDINAKAAQVNKVKVRATV